MCIYTTQKVNLKLNHCFPNIDDVIFWVHEIRFLQSLLSDYTLIAADCGYSVGDIKSSYVEWILMNEYGSDIGFTLHKYEKRTRVVWPVYDFQGVGDYIHVYKINWYKWRAAVEKRCPYRLTKSINSAQTISCGHQLLKIGWLRRHYSPLTFTFNMTQKSNRTGSRSISRNFEHGIAVIILCNRKTYCHCNDSRCECTWHDQK